MSFHRIVAEAIGFLLALVVVLAVAGFLVVIFSGADQAASPRPAHVPVPYSEK